MFSQQEADDFNWFINDSDLCEIPMEGFSFTRVSKNAAKSSKLDQFLVSHDVLNLLSDFSCLAPDLNIAYHKPIFLAQDKLDYGPRPFKIFNSRMLEDDFYQTVRLFWSKNSNNVEIVPPLFLNKS